MKDQHTVPVDYVTPSGAAWQPSSAKSGPKPKREAPEEYHRGWIVVGHEPGECARARAERERAIEEARKMDDAERASAYKTGWREPKPWDEAQWRASARKHKLRSRPFEIESSAEQMAEMARKAGWEDVEVIELAKRKA